MGSPHWTPEETALIVTMADDGLSRGQIARKLGRSRNSIIGRLHRARAKENCDEWGGPLPEAHARQMRVAESVARTVQKAKWSASFHRTIAERNAADPEVLPPLRLDNGRVIDRAGISMPFVSIQWPGYEIIPQGEVA
jgi:hypothetical protein